MKVIYRVEIPICATYVALLEREISGDASEESLIAMDARNEAIELALEGLPELTGVYLDPMGLEDIELIMP